MLLYHNLVAYSILVNHLIITLFLQLGIWLYILNQIMKCIINSTHNTFSIKQWLIIDYFEHLKKMNNCYKFMIFEIKKIIGLVYLYF
jgi:hypothetical protein